MTSGGSTRADAESMERAAAPPQPSRARAFRALLAGLARLGGVRGGLIVTPDGLVIAAELPPRSPEEALAALGATLGRELELGADRLGHGPFRTALFATDDGALFVGGSPIGFVIVLGNRGVDSASIRMALAKVLGRLRP